MYYDRPSCGSHVRQRRFLGNCQVDGRPGKLLEHGSLAEHVLTSFVDSRAMSLPGCSCGTRIQETNPEPIQVVNGRRIGKMCGWCLSTWAFLVERYAEDRLFLGIFTSAHRQVDLMKECWNNVFQPSLRIWEAGNTPNPDVWRNKSAFCVLRTTAPAETLL